MSTADLVLLSVTSSVGLVALAYMTSWIAIGIWRQCGVWVSAFWDNVAVETK